MISLFDAIYLLFAHFIADFLFQSRRVAERKSFDFYALCEHISIYQLVLGTFVLSVGAYVGWNIIGILVFLFINGVAHLFTDLLSSKASSAAFQNNNIHRFFTIIGADQFMHAAILLLTIPYLYM